MKKRLFQTEGHLIDSGVFSKILNTILQENGDYRITRFQVGKHPDETSSLEFSVSHEGASQLQHIADKLTPLGVFEQKVPSALLSPADKNRHVPEDFYSTTNHRTEIFYQNRWHEVGNQRMDAAIVLTEESTFVCSKLRDIRKGDMVVCGSDSVRVYPPAIEHKSEFAFMSNEVSSERSGTVAVELIAKELFEVRKKGGKIIVVCGPVVVHTGGADALADLIKAGYVQGFLGGNAVAVHDLEYRIYGTSLGVDLHTGKVTEHGHNHHMRAINTIYGCGSMAQAVEKGILKEGLMYDLIKSGIPYCLAGSIRDDGPLPETVNDMIEAQKRYAEIIKDADMIIMLSTMLHSIGTGNMTPSHVMTVCVDINPAVVTKLADRGSGQTVGIVSDVGLFLRELARKLEVSACILLKWN
ncbi:MAG: TIGR00300 family protein [Spirochaetales bacterium]|jgi:lysine-ketoglutarate reductase/saccharopine dehydrogenase-like protein (TIGR00300 family)|nr:TIGR00300 family protein [Spirochaetales bacterium]